MNSADKQKKRVKHVSLEETHRSGLNFVKKESVLGDERIFIGVQDSYTSIALNQREIDPLITHLKKVITKLQILRG